MPNAVARPHPLDPISGKNSFYAGGFFILDRAFMNNGERCDSRMRMPAEGRCRCRGNVKKIQEHERLDELADIRRANQARDRSVPLSPGPNYNGALRDGRYQYRAHAAIDAIFSRALNM